MLVKLYDRLDVMSVGKKLNLREFNLNFGPQHPSSHGVLRLLVQLDGELIVNLDPQIGFLHRGTEKLVESQNILNNTVYIDRLDYTSVLTQSHAYCLTIERMLGSFNLSVKTALLRTIFDELSRVLNHLLLLATSSLDIGTMAPLFWAFEDRERIMELFEYVSGARMHAALYFPTQSLDLLLSNSLILKIVLFLRNAQKSISEMFISLYNNRVWKLRLVDVANLSSSVALNYGITGPLLRSTGVAYDLRSFNSFDYGFYSNIYFNMFLGVRGDSFDRFLIRSREMFESTHIIYRCLSEFSSQLYVFPLNSLNSFSFVRSKIESVVKLFKFATGDFVLDCNCGLGSVESGKGEFYTHAISNNSNKLYRLFIRSPAFAHLQLINVLGRGHQFADIATILGTIDVVFGEVDR